MPTDLTNVSNNIQSIIDQISTTETALTINLNSATTSDALKLDITNRLGELANIKLALLNQLDPLYKSFQTNVAISNDTLSKQILALGIINAETVNSNRQFGLLTTEKQDKTRLVEINTHYGKQYNAHKQIMKTIVLVCIPIIILTILGNKGLVPNTFITLIITIIIIFGIFSIGYQIIDLSNRDKMNYDEYDWRFNKSLAPAPAPIDASSNINDPWSSNYGTCIGSSCCLSVEAYNATTNKCCPTGFKYNATSLACEAIAP
jgi:hypothetical protein